MIDSFFTESDHPFTGFGDDLNWSIKFHLLADQDGNAPDWQSGLRMATHSPATGNGEITQRRGRDPWQVSFRVWLGSIRDKERLDAMIGRRATLRYCWGVTSSLGTQPKTIEQAQYQTLPGTMLVDLADVKIEGDGTLEATATFTRPYVDPSAVTPPVWPAPPYPTLTYAQVVLATPGLRTYHRMSGAGTEASIGPDTALMTHTGSPVSVAAPGLLVHGDGAKQYSGGTMESTFSSTALSGATAGSMECWFRENSLVTWAHIFETDDYPASRLQIIRQASSSNVTVGFRDPVGAADYGCTGPYNQLALNHLVVTFGAGAIKLYINGAQVATSTHAGFFPAGAKTYRVNKIGSEANAGVVDEVAIYNVALSPATILQHYTAGTT